MKHYCNPFLFLFLLLFSVHSHAQTESNRESRLTGTSTEIIHTPTAGTLGQSELRLGLQVYPNGGVLLDTGVGILSRLYLKVYYGGENLIGEGNVNWNQHIGFDVRCRVFDETMLFPGIAVGINTQGYGGFYSQVNNTYINRYEIKSRGIYGVASRNYVTPFGDAGVHLGANVSFERSDNDKDLDIFFGSNVGIKNIGEILIEYDAGLNDNENQSFGSNRGYLNTGIRFFISNNFILTFHFTNLFKNTKSHKSFGREIRIEYRKKFSISHMANVK